MITELHLTNFRGFEKHIVPLKPFTVIVGRNNAGKSTIVEALRLVSIVVGRYKGSLDEIPARWEFPRNRRGVHPFKDLEINLQSVFHGYSDPPATIVAVFSNGYVIEISITRESITSFRTRKSGRHSSKEPVSRVSILPQVAPVAREEKLLTEDYVKSALSSALAPMHFRNQLHHLKQHFSEFKKATEITWPSLRIRELETQGELLNSQTLSLLVEDHHFSAEIAWMGHGLQMWLQTMWFLSRARDHETVILDEPDVYMHADLQRRLVRFVRERHQQVIIATHSSEIMAEILPENILIVDRSRERSDFAASLPSVQKVLSSFGSIHNLQLSRLWSSRRFLIVEGKDISLLKQFQNKLFPYTTLPLDTIPNTTVGGWGGWSQAIGSGNLLKNAAGDGIETYCLFDSDYHSEDEISSRYTEAKQRGLSLHIWRRKELENYLLVPTSIQRAIENQLVGKAIAPDVSEIEDKLNEIADSMKQDIIDAFATHIQNCDRKLSVTTANQRARKIVEARWNSLDQRLGIICGKDAFSRVSAWVQKQYRISLTGLFVAHNMTPDEVPEEMSIILTAIEYGRPFPSLPLAT